MHEQQQTRNILTCRIEEAGSKHIQQEAHIGSVSLPGSHPGASAGAQTGAGAQTRLAPQSPAAGAAARQAPCLMCQLPCRRRHCRRRFEKSAETLTVSPPVSWHLQQHGSRDVGEIHCTLLRRLSTRRRNKRLERSTSGLQAPICCQVG